MNTQIPAVLFVTTVPSTLRAFLLPFADHFRARGWRVEAAASGMAAIPALTAHFDACHELPLSRNPLSPALFAAPAAIRRLVEDGGYDLVHVHTPVAAFLVRLALRNLPVRVVYTAHGFHFHRHGAAWSNRVFRTLEQQAAPWCDRLITLNREDFDAARHFATQVLYMPGIGIDTRQWAAERIPPQAIAACRAELPLCDDDILFLQVAELTPGKRQTDTLQALALLADAHVHVAFAGTGAQEDELRALATRLGVAAQVHFLGFRNDIPVLMRASRAVLLPSAREGLPRSLLEAMSLGVPIIASDVRGCRELAEQGGLVHALGDCQGLAHCLRQLANDAALAIELGQMGSAHVREGGYDIRHIIVAHEQLYQELL